MKHLLQREKLPFSVGYIFSFIGVFYCTLRPPAFAYVWIVLFATIEVISLAYFLVSYIPGGPRALSFIGRQVGTCCRKCFGTLLG